MRQDIADAYKQLWDFSVKAVNNNGHTIHVDNTTIDAMPYETGWTVSVMSGSNFVANYVKHPASHNDIFDSVVDALENFLTE